ncbi:MAG TPA: M48 family metallopeptidase, partial [Candidatus Saccharimonadales bacterium]|nr:M48 family metallopeptidase [Candidatus Saccharimonadales bacterium]
GSCDQSKNITLNLYLMQLPWHLIDYVLLHELTHTVVFKHGPDFWAEMDKYLPDSKSLRSEMKDYKTTVSGMWHNTNYAV